MNTILKIEDLSKSFGKIKAVNHLSLEVKAGEVFGILGPNGSGKTTTLGMILDVVAPDSGSFTWFQYMKNVDARKKIGSILESPSFYPHLSAVQNLKIVAHIKQGGSDRIDHVLKMVSLDDRRDDKFKTYSLGMKQRLSIAAALLSDPPVLILDEPTNGLDPEGIAEVRSLITDIASQGKTIILASHLLDEVQKVCTRFCILRKGHKLHEGLVAETLNEINKVEVAGEDNELLLNNLKSFDGLAALEQKNGSLILSLKENYSAVDVNLFCFEKGIVLRRLLTQTNTLEQEFLKILKEND